MLCDKPMIFVRQWACRLCLPHFGSILYLRKAQIGKRNVMDQLLICTLTKTTGKCYAIFTDLYKLMRSFPTRMILCSDHNLDDLYVILHEMGHLQYYVAAEQQPIEIFKDANSALQESIGDALYLGFMTPQNLNRLGLLPDADLMSNVKPPIDMSHLELIFGKNVNEIVQNFPSNEEMAKGYDAKTGKKLGKWLRRKQKVIKEEPIPIGERNYPNITEHIGRARNFHTFKAQADKDVSVNSFDLSFLLRMALMKIPQIPFEYLLDVYRWDLFSGSIPMAAANNYLWTLIRREQGVHEPDWLDRSAGFFDAGAKFHVADNTPFVRFALGWFFGVAFSVFIWGKFTDTFWQALCMCKYFVDSAK